MAFLLYLTVIALTYIRIFEAFAPEMVVYRPVLVLSMITLVWTLIRVSSTRQIAGGARHFLILFGLICSIALSLITNGWIGGGLRAVTDFAPSALLFILTVLNVTSQAKLRATCIVIVVSILLAAAGSVAGYHFGFLGHRLLLSQSVAQEGNNETIDEEETPNVGPAEADTTEDRLVRIRNLGMLSDPNDFAQAIVMVLPFVWLLWSRGEWLMNLFLVIIPTSFLLYTVYLTHSRGALIGLSAILLLGLRKSLGTLRIVLLVVILVSTAYLANLSGSRPFSVNEESAGGRLDIWSEGLEMLRAHPLFGVGYGQFVESSESGLTAHNSVVLSLAELGVVGTFFWLALIVVAARELQVLVTLSPSINRREAHRLVIALRCSLAGFLACAFFLSRTYVPHLFLMLGLCAALSYSFYHEDVRFGVRRPVKWLPQSAAALIGCILVLYVVIRFKHAFGS